MSPTVLASEHGTPHKMTMIRRTVIVRKGKDMLHPSCSNILHSISGRRLQGVVCGGIFRRCRRRHPSLQESGGVPLVEHGNPPTPSPPSATPQQTSCWDLLPPLASSLATIRGGGENTNRGINCSLPPHLILLLSSPVLNNKTIIYPPSVYSAFLFSLLFGQKSGSNGFLSE